VEAREPAGYRHSDRALKERILRQLALAEGLDASSITVEVKDCEVTLSGSVRCSPDMQRVEELACAIEGVKLVRQRPHVCRAAAAGRRRRACGHRRRRWKAWIRALVRGE